MDDDECDALCDRLRLKWLPFAEGFDVAHTDDYERFWRSRTTSRPP